MSLKQARTGKIWKIGAVLSLALAMFGWLALPNSAAAHPLGNFTVNRYSRLEIGAAGVKIYYVLDVAEIPTFQEKDIIDLNHDDQISPTEQQTYLTNKVEEIKSNLKLTLNDAPAELKVAQSNLAFLPGQGGLQTMRLTARFDTAALPTNAANLSYQDTNYNDRLGWREIVVRNANGVAINQSSAPNTDQSNELRTYPQDMLASPLNVSSAQVSIKLDPSVIVNEATGATVSSGVIDRAQDPFADLINGGELTLGALLLSFLIAFGLGMLHALSPGHGKSVVAAYLVGTRGTPRHAIFLGVTVTVTHTLGVFALGLITLFASQYILPEKLYPWLGLASGLIVLVMGLTLLRSRLRYAGVGASNKAHLHADHKHDQPEHTHDHKHEHEHSHQQAHNHAPAPQYALAAQVHEHAEATLNQTYQLDNESHHSDIHEHSHDHDFQPEHTHDHEQHFHTHDEHEHSHDHDHSHSHEGDAHVHSHGGKAHSHLPPGADGTALTWKRLLLFGISAGLLPCPSALVVMLSAIALGRTAFGLVLIIFFSIGLAATLTGMGLLLVLARKFTSKMNFKSTGRLVRTLPVISAFAVAIIGIIISYEALIQTGIFNK